MAKRRGNKEGSIYQLPNGTWRAQVRLNGERLGFTADTRKKAQEWLKKIQAQIDDGLTYSSSKITVSEFMTSWLSSSKGSKRYTTWTQYNMVFQKYIEPEIGKIKIIDCSPVKIQKFYDGLLSRDVGIYVVRKIHTVLRSALSQAVRLGIISRNPAGVVIQPQEPSKEMKILNESQVSQLLVAAKGHRWEALYQLDVVTGMRQMELLGLKWVDVDWKKQTIKVERQLLRAHGEGVQFSDPKTMHGKRTLSLGPSTIKILRSHYERQQLERIAAGDKWQENGLIFTTHHGNAIQYRNLIRDFQLLLKKAGLPHIRFHDLRHTAASILLNNKIPVLDVSRMLGHAKPSITLNTYGHLMPNSQMELARLMDEIVTPVELHINGTQMAHKSPPLFALFQEGAISGVQESENPCI